MTTRTERTIHALAREFDRLCPDQVDSTPIPYGHGTESGHIGHPSRDDDTESIIGWYADGGNVGHPVL